MDLKVDMSGKTMVVTGASSGIGRAIAIALNDAGAHVILISRDAQRLEETRQKMKYPQLSTVMRFDLSQIESIGQLVAEFPKVSGIVFAAGIMHTMPFKFISSTALQNVMKINFEAPTFFMQQVIKQQKLTNGGSVVYISSIAGNVSATIGNAMYSASKSALQATVKVLALELASKKIRVNSIAPGMVKTEMWSKENSTITEEQLIEDEKKYPLGYGAPEDISGLALFLLSDSSRWITGSMIVADGGFTIQ
jgi:NAD(P)-dependent dehydrogenase (short-subunit alcohol dehydrogenase family)